MLLVAPTLQSGQPPTNNGRKDYDLRAFNHLEFFPCAAFIFILLMFSIPFNSASGLKEMLSICCPTRNDANSGESLGPWPHNPILIPFCFAFFIIEAMVCFTASFSSSKISPALISCTSSFHRRHIVAI